MNDRPSIFRRVALAAAAVAILTVGWLFWLSRGSEQTPAPRVPDAPASPTAPSDTPPQSRAPKVVVPPGAKRFQPLTDQNARRTDEVLIEYGVRANPAQYSSTVFVESAECSGVLVGPQVLLSAAHCYVNEETVYFDTVTDARVKGVCHPNPGYNPGKKIGDLALCLLDDPISATYETVNTNPTRLKKGASLLLAGWGQTEQEGTVAGGQFTIGNATISKIFQPPASDAIQTSNGAGVADGDSGGAAFLHDSSAPNGRWLVGVNSKFDENSKPGISYISSLASTYAEEFFRAFREKHKAKAPLICSDVASDPICPSKKMP
jgi:hypothetical protein